MFDLYDQAHGLQACPPVQPTRLLVVPAMAHGGVAHQLLWLLARRLAREGEQVLVLDGIARAIAHKDVDGDGLPDLVAGAIKPDLIDALRAATSEKVDAQVYVYLNKRGTYSKRPDLAWTVSIKAARFDAQIEVVGDLTGDGVAELLVRSEPEKARIVMLRKGRDGALSLVEKPLWEGRLDPDARLLAPAGLDKRSPDLFWITKGGVSCTSFY